ncbi:O-antigen ligase family protein [Bacillus cereus]|uniref:O-antigen ligase family protein n=2 Tax=Bacillus cereus TaxID=1396 RepID=UPI003CF3E32B
MGFVLLGIFIICLIKNNYVFALSVYIIGLLGIPRNNDIERLFGIGIDINGSIFFDLRWLIVTIMFVFVIFKLDKNKIEFKMFNLIWFFMLLCMFMIALIKGLINGNPLIKSEMLLYIQIFIILVTLVLWVKKFKIKSIDLLNMCIVGGSVYSVIAILLSLFWKDYLPSVYGDFYSEIWGATGRVTFQNVTALFMISFFSLYMIFTGKNVKINFLAIILFNIAILLSQTRSIIALYYVCFFIIGSYIFMRYLLSKSLKLKNLVFISICIPLICVVFLVVLKTFHIEDSVVLDILNRFNEGTGSIDSRVYTNNNILEDMTDPVLGNGIGYPLEFLNAGGHLVSEGSWVDNFFLSFYSKFGLVGVGIVIVIMICVFWLNIKCFIETKNEYFIIISIVYIPFLIICSFLTSQIIHSIQVCIIYFLIALIPNINKKINECGSINNNG